MPVTRLYESEHDVQRALEHLKASLEEELIEEVETQEFLMVINPADPDASAALQSAKAAGAIRDGQGGYFADGLSRGRWVIAAAPSWTIEGLVEKSLDKFAVDQDAIPDVPFYNPTPFSDLLGLPVLISGDSDTDLIDFDIDSSFGLPLLIDNPTPYSSLLRLPVLKPPTVSRLGLPLLKSPTVSRLGLPMLKKPKSARGTAIERLSGNPAPFSKLLGLPVLTKRR